MDGFKTMTIEELQQQIEQTEQQLNELEELRDKLIIDSYSYLNKCWKITDDRTIRIFKCFKEKRDNYGALLFISGEIFTITSPLRYSSSHELYPSYLTMTEIEQITEEEYKKLLKDALNQIESYSQV